MTVYRFLRPALALTTLVSALAACGTDGGVAPAPPIAIQFDPDGYQSGFHAVPGDTIAFRVALRYGTGSVAPAPAGSLAWTVRNPAVGTGVASADGSRALVIVKGGGITWLVGEFTGPGGKFRDSTRLDVILRN